MFFNERSKQVFEYTIVHWAGGLRREHMAQLARVVAGSIAAEAWRPVHVGNGFEVDEPAFINARLGPRTAFQYLNEYLAWPSKVGPVSQTLVIRQVPATPLVLQCSLRARGITLEASFTTLSGSNPMPSAKFLSRPIVRVRDIAHQTRKTALASGLLRSTRQQLQIILEGFHALPADDAVVWSERIRTRPSKTRLIRKTNLSNVNLRAVLRAACQRKTS